MHSLPSLPYRLIGTILAAFAILAAALGMVGCSSTTASTSGYGNGNAVDQAAAAAKFEKDRAAILGMVGEYDVTFDFEETLAVREGYELAEAYTSKASEMVVVVKDTGDLISLQHLLVVFHDGDAHVVKHWRQDWAYEATKGYDFQGDNVWEPVTYSEDAVAGAWVQSVYQVDDSPRYWGVGQWTHEGELSTWTASANRPLPRREFSKRDDYQVLGAVNTHVVTPTGWMHYQHNHKIDKENQAEPVIALEVGVNSYIKSDDTDFSAAKEYWENTAAYWAEVRAAWSDVYAQHQTLTLSSRWKGDKMYSHIFDLADEYWGADDVTTARAKVQTVIDAFMQPEQVASP